MTEKIVSVSIANLYAEPSFRSELLTQAFLGEKLKVLTDNGHWLKVVCPDDYIGWIRYNTIVTDDNWSGFSGDLFTYDELVTNVFSDTEMRHMFQKVTLMSSVYLITRKNDQVQVKLPDKEAGWMLDWPLTIVGQTVCDKIVSTAHRFIGIPYLWGAKSAFGTDCSELIHLVFRLCGIAMKRNTGDQFRMHELMDTDIRDALPGDLCFFGENAEIAHVGIYIGNNEILHFSGWIHINSLNESAPHFSEVLKKHLLHANRFGNCYDER